MNIRLGLIGCGEHSEIGHAVPLARYAAAHADAITLTAACDLCQERAELFCGKYGFARSYQEADEMLTMEQLDVCVAVTPVERIAEIGIRLIRSRHALCCGEASRCHDWRSKSLMWGRKKH